MIIERICFYAGAAATDLTIVAISSTGVFRAARTLRIIATVHRINSGDITAVSNNLFECLPMLD